MKKIIFLFLLVLSLAGCSTKFTYNNIDWLIYWYIDDYIEFTDEQEKAFDVKLSEWLTWHRQTEFPLYLAHIDELIKDIEQNALSIERMEHHTEKAREHWQRLRARVAPDLVDMSFMLSDEQVVYLFAALEKDLQEEAEEYQKRLEKSADKRKKEWISRNEDSLEDWFGSLTSEQESFIKNSYQNFSPTRQFWIDYKTDYQSALRKAFASRDHNPEFKTELEYLLTNPEVYRSDAFIMASEQNTKRSHEYLLTLLTLSTEKQRKELIEQINDYREDIVDLAE
ncbi:DUF6279 family lipoprotein [Glaciecola sp. 1036]|uniref:DUF6279 family lipoprotein n=1 Tax=Alteromonadaceae TaxID=72275 RepID=UPI003D0317C1